MDTHTEVGYDKGLSRLVGEKLQHHLQDALDCFIGKPITEGLKMEMVDIVRSQLANYAEQKSEHLKFDVIEDPDNKDLIHIKPANLYTAIVQLGLKLPLPTDLDGCNEYKGEEGLVMRDEKGDFFFIPARPTERITFECTLDPGFIKHAVNYGVD